MSHPSRALVLGCGPAGLLAAHACKLAGLQVRVASIKQKSQLGGAQYLHHSIPYLTPTAPDSSLVVHGWGTKRGYAQKVYGDRSHPVSWDLMLGDRDEEVHPIWDMVKMYERLWMQWEPEIIDVQLDARMLRNLLEDGGFEIVVNSVHANTICKKKGEHEFPMQPIIISPTLPDELEGDVGRDGSEIIYNGSPEDLWYRVSSVFGRDMTEWSFETPGMVKRNLDPFHDSPHMTIHKPLSTTCDCWDGEVVKVGRFGKWSKGDLVTDAYDEVVHELSR